MFTSDQVRTTQQGRVIKTFQPGDFAIFLEPLSFDGGRVPTPEEVIFSGYFDRIHELNIEVEQPIEVEGPRTSHTVIAVYGGSLPSSCLMHVNELDPGLLFRPDWDLSGRWARGDEARYCCPSCMTLGLDATACRHEEVVAGTCLVCDICKAQIWTARKGVIITPDPASEGETSWEMV